jgi:2-hydroxychromene-2-carboxylate isomerase
MAGSSTAEPDTQPVFYFDLASPECYLAAERVNGALGVVPEWVPIAAPAPVPAPDRAAFEALATERGLQAVRWPAQVPFDSDLALRVATYAKQVGRAVAFSLAAFRQAYAGGRDLGEADNVLIAASACEMHPTAVLKSAGLRSIAQRLERAGALARERGVRDVPAVWLPEGRVLHGDAALDAASRRT